MQRCGGTKGQGEFWEIPEVFDEINEVQDLRMQIGSSVARTILDRQGFTSKRSLCGRTG